MNRRLAESASPYLRAHADNPVPWFAWGPEAFAEAARRDVPVLVSIGYSTCHWCHVMARESFQDAATAAALAEGFVAIKVDREEHPEVDAAYMAAASAFTENLGWPLTVFTTPDGAPFYAGTYFPPEPRAGLASFRQVLAAISEAWAGRRAAIEATADAVVDALASVHGAPDGEVSGSDARGALADAARTLAGREDPRYGGFAPANALMTTPKFPVATALRFLQARAVREAEPAASAVATRALAAMAGSPLRDAVDGGFFRYATRRDWTVPHYERMLVDNAQLLDVAVAEGDEATARGVAAFLLGVLRQPSGAFGAAQDSESWMDGARSEGGYYARDAAGRAALEPPAVDGKVVTGWNGLAIGALARAGAALGEREWVEAARVAADAVLRRNVDASGRLVRASLGEVVSPAPATLADHGQLAGGLVALAVATGEVSYAVRARELVGACVQPDGALAAPGGGDTVLARRGIGAPDAASDGDEPSGPAALADATIALWRLGADVLASDSPNSTSRDAGPGGTSRDTGEGDPLGDTPSGRVVDPRRLAERIIAAYVEGALAQPLAHGALLAAAAALAVPPHQVVVVTGGSQKADADGDSAGARSAARADGSPVAPAIGGVDDQSGTALVRAAHRLPADVVMVVTEAQARAWADAGFSLFAGKERLGGVATAYDCRDFTCRLPVTEPELLVVPGA